MRERIKDYDRLLHIMEAIANVFEFMEGKTVDDNSLCIDITLGSDLSANDRIDCGLCSLSLAAK